MHVSAPDGTLSRSQFAFSVLGSRLVNYFNVRKSSTAANAKSDKKYNNTQEKLRSKKCDKRMPCTVYNQFSV